MNSELLFYYDPVTFVLLSFDFVVKIKMNSIYYDVSKVNLKLVNQKRILINTALAHVMLLTPDVKMVSMKEYAQNLIFRQYHIQVS